MARPTITLPGHMKGTISVRGKETLTLEAEVYGIPEPTVTWHWYDRNHRRYYELPGSYLFWKDEMSTTEVDTGAHSKKVQIEIRCIRKRNEGTFKLVASNREGEVSEEFEVRVNDSDFLHKVKMFPFGLFK